MYAFSSIKLLDKFYKCHRCCKSCSIIRFTVDEAKGALLMLLKQMPDSSNLTRICSARGTLEASGATFSGLQYLVHHLIKEVYCLEFPCV